LKTDQLRKKFLEFFKKKEHRIFPSDSLVPQDPTVLFTSAGMNQFKPYFLGIKKDCRRAASCQKCLRTDDLDKVGKTPYHHTFFEMLGNFSFGDYFKKEAIEFAWEFVTQDLNLKEKDLWISVYENDDEAYRIWKEYIGVSSDKIVKLGEDKNFWPANAPLLGPNGPCGPCSEIFFDKGKEKGCGKKDCNPSCECGRFVEIWNLVFTQFNRIDKNKLEPLPQKNIDTGMGLERVVSVLQNKNSNFEIDILYPIVKFLREILPSERKDLIYAMVDHIRAATFAINDGVFPSNEERGYVVRKLIRNAVWKANILGKKEPFLYRLVSLYGETMKDPYPEIYKNRDDISKVIRAEEERFLSTLEAGKKQIIELIRESKNNQKYIIGAEELFTLYDTYGFPVELSKEFAAKHNMKVDMEGFKKLLQRQRQLSRKRSMFEDSIFSSSDEDKIVKGEVTEFVGYDNFEIESKILKLIKGNKETEVLFQNDEGYIILDKTPFYPESGGQLFDKGWIKTEEGEFFVEEVFKVEEAIIHKGKVIKGEVHRGKVTALIDKKRRKGLARAHTATHLLQAALRKILGTHVTQQGSLVDVDRLRFDFTHFKGLSKEEIEKVEDLVNEFVLNADKVEKKIVDLEVAKKEGALAFFKEKYQEKVRLVSISSYSKELCGGTHLENTSEVGLFLIVSESSISSGIRRIEALVGKSAYQYFKEVKKDYLDINKLLKSKPQELKPSIERLLEEVKRERQKRENLERQLISLKIDEIISYKKQVEDKNYLIYELKEKDYTQLLHIWDVIRVKLNSIFVFLLSKHLEKHIFICAVTDDFIKKGLTSKKFLEVYKNELSLKGGGRDNFVQGIITDKERDYIRRLENSICEYLNKK
jgi:alanyl-tRNA synthetase